MEIEINWKIVHPEAVLHGALLDCVTFEAYYRARKEGWMAMEATREKLVSDLKVLVTDAEELLKATANQAGEKIVTARQHIEQSLEEGKKTLAEAEDVLIDKTKEAAKAADIYVRENPWNAVGIAAGIGLVLGLLIRRS